MIDIEVSNGDLLDRRYKVFDRKAGGMGEVFFCLDLANDRKPVAVKTYFGTWDRAARTQFMSEIDACLRIPKAEHNYYLGINRVFIVHEKPFIEMEYCPGGSLADAIADSTLDMQSFAKMALELGFGMKALHENYGLLHRDIKPSNILFDEQGRVKIADLGIAKVSNGIQPESSRFFSASGLFGRDTQVGSFIGTLAYASPEQLSDSSKTAPTTDIWSFGAVLFEALTGVHPFSRKDINATVQAILKAEVPWTLLNSANQDIIRIIRRCLMVRPADRIQSFRAILKEFDGAIRFPSSPEISTSTNLIYINNEQLEQHWVDLFPERQPKGSSHALNFGALNRRKEAASYLAVGMNQRALDTIKMATGSLNDPASLLSRYIHGSLLDNVQFEDRGHKTIVVPPRSLVEAMIELQLRALLNVLEEGNAGVKQEYLELVNAVKDHVTSHDAIISCAQGFIKLELYSIAINTLKKVGNVDSLGARYWGSYTNALFGQGNIEAILDLWESEIYPSIGESDDRSDLYTCAKISSMLRFTKGCLHYYGKLHELQPNNQSITYNLAIALVNSGRLDAATDLLTELEEMDPESPFARHLKTALAHS
jgi:serine/threonine protein kinase